MSTEFQPATISPHNSLRTRIALGVALPILLVLALFTALHYLRERHLVETQIGLTAQQLGELAMGSLRHSMETNDRAMLDEILRDLNGMQSIRRVQIIGLDGQVKADSLGRNVDAVMDASDAGCIECHAAASEALPRTTMLSSPSNTLRVARPIQNEAACAECHPQPGTHLGVLLVDVWLADLEQHVVNDLRVDLLFSAGITVLATLGIYVLINRMVLRRVAAFRRPLTEFAQGHFNSRMPIPLHPSDEIDALSIAFNRMADEVERHTREASARADLRQRAIVEERDRIARELHDGLAQLLGYVNTKASAVRLMLKNRQTEAAEKHLLQLEEAAQELFVDVREAILGLKMNGQNGAGLPAALRDYTAQFSRLCSLPVDLRVEPSAELLSLPAETELQLMRIVQESLTNVRKHALARQATVHLRVCDGSLELLVCDNGTGFVPGQTRGDTLPHYGLSTMRERAEAIGAAFSLETDPGAGTCVAVRMKVESHGHAAHPRSG